MKATQLITGMAIAIGLCFTFHIGVSAQINKVKNKKMEKVERRASKESKLQTIDEMKKQAIADAKKKIISKEYKQIIKNLPKVVAVDGGSIIILPPYKPLGEQGKRQNFLNRWAPYNLGGNSSNPVGEHFAVWTYGTLSCPSGYRLPTIKEMSTLMNEYTIFIQRDLSKNPGNLDGLWIGIDQETCMKATKNNMNGCIFLPVTNLYSEPYGWSSVYTNFGFYMTSSLAPSSSPMIIAMCFFMLSSDRAPSHLEDNYQGYIECYENWYSAKEPDLGAKNFLFIRPIEK